MVPSARERKLGHHLRLGVDNNPLIQLPSRAPPPGRQPGSVGAHAWLASRDIIPHHFCSPRTLVLDRVASRARRLLCMLNPIPTASITLPHPNALTKKWVPPCFPPSLWIPIPFPQQPHLRRSGSRCLSLSGRTCLCVWRRKSLAWFHTRDVSEGGHGVSSFRYLLRALHAGGTHSHKTSHNSSSYHDASDNEALSRVGASVGGCIHSRSVIGVDYHLRQIDWWPLSHMWEHDGATDPRVDHVLKVVANTKSMRRSGYVSNEPQDAVLSESSQGQAEALS
ncbi:hypothetical protein RRG08_024745 [Elysia crispata]|uniref:Uncharacterized protein n=1 Tax=Elysia crispata TaxID=231223 RepID=A0AAE1CWQ5_9GAST|nr:hypothetical protein RRG08_024745 [Elysia crispata]